MVGGGVKGRAGRARKPGWGATRLGYARDNEKIGRSNRTAAIPQYST